MTDQNLPPPSEYEKQHWKQAERAFDAEAKGQEIVSKQIEAFAVLTLRSLGLAAVGGIAAVLGFYSANYSRLSVAAGALETLNHILSALFLTLLGHLLAAGLGYFSQIAYSSAISTKKHSYLHPYVTDTPLSQRYEFMGDICRWGAVVFSAASVLLLVYAGVSFTRLVR